MPSPAKSSLLDALDDTLVEVRRLLQRPEYRRRLRAKIGTSVPVGSLRVLRCVERAAGEALSVGEIADKLAVDPSTASRMVDQNVEAGHLTRRQSVQDRRRTLLVLTDAGAQLLQRATQVRREVLADVTEDWSDADVTQLVELLTRLRDSFDRLEQSS